MEAFGKALMCLGLVRLEVRRTFAGRLGCELQGRFQSSSLTMPAWALEPSECSESSDPHEAPSLDQPRGEAFCSLRRATPAYFFFPPRLPLQGLDSAELAGQLRAAHAKGTVRP